VYRYNGVRWVAENSGLPSESVVTGLIIDHENELWASIDSDFQPVIETSGKSDEGTISAVYRFEGNRWVGHDKGLPPQSDVRALSIDKENRLWAGLTGGVYRYDGYQWTSQYAGLPGRSNVTTVLVDNEDHVWAGTGNQFRNAIYRSDGGRWTIQNVGLPAQPFVNELIASDENQLWAAVFGGVYRYEGGQWVSQSTGLPEDASIYNLLLDNGGRLWAGLADGVYQYDGDQWISLNVGMPEQPRIRKLLVDNEDQLWAVVGGIATFVDSDGITSPREVGGIYHYDGEQWLSHSPGLPDESNVRTLLLDHNNHLWAGVDGGVYQYDGEQWTPQSSGLPEQARIAALVMDGKDRLWAHVSSVAAISSGSGGAILTAGASGAYRFDGTRWLVQNSGLPEPVNIWRLTAENGTLWISTSTGIYRYEGEQWEPYITNVPEQAFGNALLIDKENQVWLGRNGGVYKYIEDQWKKQSDFVEMPSAIGRMDDDFVLVFNDFSLMTSSDNMSGSRVPMLFPAAGADPPLDLGRARLYSVRDGVGLRAPSRDIKVSGDPGHAMFRYADGQVWFSEDALFWNPIGNLDQGPLGAGVDEHDQVKLWLYRSQDGADTVKEYSLGIPWFIRLHPLAILLAIGRSAGFVQVFLLLTGLYYSYLLAIYLLAGNSNGIPFRQFFQLHWESSNLLDRLLSRDRDSYTALRLVVHQLNDLQKLMFVLMQPHKAYSPKELVAELQKHEVSPKIQDVSDGLRRLVRKGLLAQSSEQFSHSEQDLVTVYQQTYEDADKQILIRAVREQDPVAIDAIRFFEQAGFVVAERFGQNLILQPQSKTRLEQFEHRVLARVMPNQELRAADVRALVEQAGKELVDSGKVDKRIIFIVINEPADMGAYAQMDSYRWGEDIILIPLTHQRMRSALTESICEMELNSVLYEYLAENPDLYNQRNPVRDEHYFGRNRDQQLLLSYPNQGQPLGIFALNKMGKTSFINRLAEHMTDRAVVVVDLQKVAKNARAVYSSLVQGLVKDIAQKWRLSEFSDLHLLRGTEQSNDLAADFVHDLDVLYRILLTQTPDPRFVIFIDEIDRLIPGEDVELAAGFEGYNDLLSMLRGVSQTGLPLTFVVIGVQPQINRRAQLAGTENAGFSVFEEYFLPPLDREECDLMVSTIGHKMGLMYSEAALEQIFAESGGHPFLARQLCSLAWRNLKNSRSQGNFIEVSEEDINRAVLAFLDDQGRCAYYKELYQTRLSPEEQKVVLQLSAAEVQTFGQSGEASILRDLSKRHILMQSNHSFRIAYGMFRRWLRREILELEE
jgi:ligand-binding sensor domain-containing protein